MPESKRIVINTGPLIALCAALNDFSVLRECYDEVFVPFEVCSEILAGGVEGFAVTQFQNDRWLTKWDSPVNLSPFLKNALDPGEAAVIQLAREKGIETVCIDERFGRRIARLHSLKLTGSVGVLIRAFVDHAEGAPVPWAADGGLNQQGIGFARGAVYGAFVVHYQLNVSAADARRVLQASTYGTRAA